MRRLLCLMLLATFGMPLLAPLLASAQAPETSLPACCRRTGKHHCALGMALAASGTESQTPHWSAPPSKCPCCPEVARVFSHHDTTAMAGATQTVYVDFARPLGRVQTESRRRIARERSRHKRGPPSLFLA